MQYALGRVLLVRSRSVSELARRMGEQAVDALHHFLDDSPWSEGWAAWQQYATIAERVRARGERMRLILDDTPVERAGPHIEGLGIHHSAKGLIRGQCAVTAVVKAGALTLAWAVRGYVPQGACGHDEFQSKVELALAILWSAQRHWIPAYNALQFWNASRPPRCRCKTFGQTVRAFRAAVSEDDAVRWCRRYAEAA